MLALRRNLLLSALASVLVFAIAAAPWLRSSLGRGLGAPPGAAARPVAPPGAVASPSAPIAPVAPIVAPPPVLTLEVDELEAGDDELAAPADGEVHSACAAAPPAIDPLNPEASTERAWLVAEGPHRDRLSGRRLVTLTFDDGPGPRSTPLVLDELKKFEAKATFFLIADYFTAGSERRAERVRAIAERMVAEGHTIASHSLEHRLLTTQSKAEVVRQIDQAHELITLHTGVSPRYFRPPYGGLDAFGSSQLRAHGYQLVLWSVEAQDMVRDDEDGVFEDIRRQLEYAEGGIVLLHDVKMQTVRVTKRLLEYLHHRRFDPEKPQRKGFEIVDLPTYLKETEERPQPFANRTELAQARRGQWRQRHAKVEPRPREAAQRR